MSMRHQLQDTAATRPRTAPGDNLVTPLEIAAAVGASAPSALQTLLAHSRRASYDAQDTLYRQNSENGTVFFVTTGLIKLVSHLRNGRMRIVRLHRPGSVLGLSGLRGRPHEHTAVAVTPVHALRLPLGALQHLRSTDPATYVTLVERWHDYLRDADTWITQFSTGPIRGRVARLLAFLSEFEPEAAEGRVQLLTCEEMGSMLGVTSESVSRTLAEFKRQNILVSEQHRTGELYQTDMDRLLDIAQEE